MKKHNWITIGLTLLIALMIAVSCEKPQNEPGTPEVESDSIVIRDSSVICYGTVLSDGGDSIRERGICWYGEPYPTSISDHTPPVISDHRMVAGGDLGSFSRTLNHFGSDLIYYFRAYARNDVGVSYGSEMGFRCIYDPNLDDPDDDEPATPVPVLLEDIPSVTISPVTDITLNSAVCHGAITDNGGSAIIEKGFCWRREGNPLSYEYMSVLGSDMFQGVLNRLVPNTTYYVRAYAFNGKGTGYSNEISFTTLQGDIPLISILSGPGLLGEGMFVDSDDYDFGFEMSSTVGLSSMKFYWGSSYLENITLENWADSVFLSGMNSYIYRGTVTFPELSCSIDSQIDVDIVLMAVVTDVNGVSNCVSFTCFYDVDCPLVGYEVYGSSSDDDVWEEIGMAWIGNNGGFAHFRPLPEVRLFSFDASVWSAVTTEDELVAVFDNLGTPIGEYANVSVVPTEWEIEHCENCEYINHDYDDFLGVILPDGSMKLIHVMTARIYPSTCYIYMQYKEYKKWRVINK